MSDAMDWEPVDGGVTIGQVGSEDGLILRDEEYASAARITLETGGVIAPYSITCGIYGWMCHTRFFSDERSANDDFDRMKLELASLVNMIPDEGDSDLPIRRDRAVTAIQEFVHRFP